MRKKWLDTNFIPLDSENLNFLRDLSYYFLNHIGQISKRNPISKSHWKFEFLNFELTIRFDIENESGIEKYGVTYNMRSWPHVWWRIWKYGNSKISFLIHWNKILIKAVKAKGVAFEYLLWPVFSLWSIFEFLVLEHYQWILDQNAPLNEIFLYWF